VAAQPAPATRPRAHARPRLRPAPAPRRVGGPAGRSRTAAPPPATALPGLGLDRALDALRGLPDARWLDRLLRGQGWIVLIGIALMGIVAMQVTLLKMNTGIGESIERAGALERHNADLRAEVSRLSSEERIETQAQRLGMVMPDAGAFRYVTVRGERDARRAAAVMRAPDPVEEVAAAAAATATQTATAAPQTAATQTAAPQTATTATQTAPMQATTPPAATAPPPAATATPATPAPGQ
jgi:cell division protein FtsL